MATAEDLRRAALALEGTTEAPHFDRAAFKVAHICVTLAADGLTANLMLSPDEQAHLCAADPGAFAPLPNAWGRRGATQARLAALDADGLGAALRLAWDRAGAAKRPRGR